MNLKIILAAVAVIVVLLLGGYYYFFINNVATPKKAKEHFLDRRVFDLSLSPVTISLVGGKINQKATVLLGITTDSASNLSFLKNTKTFLVSIVFTTLSSFLPVYFAENDTISMDIVVKRIKNALDQELPKVGINTNIIKNVFVVHFKVEPVV